MKATELRIGNFYDNNGVFKKASPSTIEEVWDAPRSWCKAIPLTEEWLLKFGFEITDNFQTKDRFQTHKQDGIIWFEYGYIVVELNYVHQLQNLYFALTGEELIIKN
jgi:hypothetical protein